MTKGINPVTFKFCFAGIVQYNIGKLQRDMFKASVSHDTCIACAATVAFLRHGDEMGCVDAF